MKNFPHFIGSTAFLQMGVLATLREEIFRHQQNTAIIVASVFSNVYYSEVIARVTNSKKNHAKVAFAIMPKWT